MAYSGSVLLLLLLAFVPFCYSQCTARCSLPLTTCNFINYNIYTPAGTNITAIERQAANIITTTNSLDSPCKDFISRFVCSISYKSCDSSNAPVSPCSQVCTDFQSVCGAFNITLPESLAPYLNCTEVDSNGSSLYSLSPSPSCHANPSTQPHVCPLPPSVLPPVRCVKWNTSAANFTGKFCAPFVTSEIHIQGSIAAVDNGTYLNALRYVAPYFPLLPVGCYKSLMSFICSTSFPPCNRIYNEEYNQTTSLPVRPCRSMCEDRSRLCDEMLTLLGVPLAGCATSPLGPIVPTPLNTTDRRYTVILNNTCRTETIPKDALVKYELPDFDTCPSVLARIENPSEEKNQPRCWLKCPDASYTPAEWDTLVVLTQVGASLSFVTMSFLLITYLLHHERRKFPQNLHMFEFLSCIMLSITFFLNGLNPQKDVWCKDEGTFATQSNNATCGAQGFLFIMFGLSVATWCCVIAFIMFRAILLSRKISTMAHWVKYFHLFAWGIPLILAITALATNSIGYGVPLAWCFIQFSGFGFGSTYSGISIDYYVFYIPIGILFVLITTMFGITVFKIYNVRRLQIAKTGNSIKGSKTLLAQIRLLVFIFAVFIICFTIFEWRFQIEAENSKHSFDKVGIDWIACKIKNEINNTAKFEINNCPGDVPPARINYEHTQAESFLISAIGFFMFFGFGSDMGLYRHWSKILRLLFRGEGVQLRDLVFYGKDPFGSSTKSKSDSNSASGTSGKHSKNSKNSKNSKKTKNSNFSGIGVGSGTGSDSQFSTTDEDETITGGTGTGGVELSTKTTATVYLA